MGGSWTKCCSCCICGMKGRGVACCSMKGCGAACCRGCSCSMKGCGAACPCIHPLLAGHIADSESNVLSDFALILLLVATK